MNKKIRKDHHLFTKLDRWHQQQRVNQLPYIPLLFLRPEYLCFEAFNPCESSFCVRILLIILTILIKYNINLLTIHLISMSKKHFKTLQETTSDPCFYLNASSVDCTSVSVLLNPIQNWGSTCKISWEISEQTKPVSSAVPCCLWNILNGCVRSLLRNFICLSARGTYKIINSFALGEPSPQSAPAPSLKMSESWVYCSGLEVLLKVECQRNLSNF